MKKIITIIMVLCFVFSLSVTSTFANSNTEYVKVKKSTYQKYKKGYQKYKKALNEKYELQKELGNMTVQYEDAMDLYELAAEDAEQQTAINDWLWNSLSGMNIRYKNKTWTVKEIPETFYVRGTEYTVRKEF